MGKNLSHKLFYNKILIIGIKTCLAPRVTIYLGE